MVPSKSGVLGLLAAAEGRRRCDPIEDLAHLAFGVRVDQPGSLQRDFQTAINWDSGAVMPLSYRYYVADAVFVAGVEGDQSLLEGLADKIQHPTFALYLGRRSCPTTGELFLDLVDGHLLDALESCPWQASDWHRRRQPRSLEVDLHIDASAISADSIGVPIETRRDVPESFNPERREYGWRDVAQLSCPIENDLGWVPTASDSDWMSAVLESKES